MKTLIQKIHVEEHRSFACRTYKTPNFETAWHKHPECELILITEGNGTALIGDYIGEYKEGDVFFLSPDLPHWFRKSEHTMVGSAIVIHFLRDFVGEVFLSLPELKSVARQLESKDTGILLQERLSCDVAVLIKEIEQAEGLTRIQLLLNCLQRMGSSTAQRTITKAFDTLTGGEEDALIETIIDYSFKHYLGPLSLKEVAEIARMSIPSFCRFFKRNIKKSYFDFIREIRIGRACKLLRETNRPILDICYDSGYNSWPNFSKQFKDVTRRSPSQYRKEHLSHH
ncbi:helix-turn-helix domain-containing protein [Pedobacter caeni]|uniref:Transcriptional regulator, AraC family n=1 Tax=Pedobacter caeni TaxID=288992 RepID=A0A1M5JJ41_9SPHI|nr:helix-turn-helix domain-containing protein [Pedobacter caeni]SHG40567.1 transcriptional regulator, AraC family [Pedobacter caeni]